MDNIIILVACVAIWCGALLLGLAAVKVLKWWWR